MPRVLLLFPTSTYKAHDFLEAGRRLGAEVVVASDRRQALAGEAAGTTLTLDLGDPQAAARAISALHAEAPYGAILGVDDDTALVAAAAAAAVGLPHNPPEAVRAAGDKELFRARQLAAGLPCPRAMTVPLDADPELLACGTEYPCVLKPTFLAASRGVIRADSPAAFVAAFARLRALLRRPEVRARGGAAAGRILVEEYVDGAELALEALLHDGALVPLRLFDKPDPLVGPYFEETLYVAPARIPARERRAVLGAVSANVAALGLTHGPVHAEIRLPPAGAPIVLEIAPRTIGGLCGRCLRFAGGISFAEVVLRHALGEPVPPAAETPATGVMMIPIPRRGILRAVEGIERAAAMPRIRGVTLSARLGHEIVPLPEGNRYLGFVFADGDEPDGVEAALRAACAELEIRIEPGPGAEDHPAGEPPSRDHLA